MGVEANITKLAESAASFGFININPDQDGTLRHALLMVRYQDQDFFPSLDLEVVREYEKIRDQDIAAYIAPNGLEHIQFGRHTLRHARDGSALINYTGPYRTYQHYSMSDVISGAVPPETFRDKIVLIGPTALGIGDMRNTPFANQDPVYMGVEVHANIIDNLLHNEEKGRGFLQRTELSGNGGFGDLFCCSVLASASCSAASLRSIPRFWCYWRSPVTAGSYISASRRRATGSAS